MTGMVMITKGGGCGGGGAVKVGARGPASSMEEQNQLSLVAVLLAALRKSMVSCRVYRGEDVMAGVHDMEIGWPTNVRHVTHVTFDRFNGFLGLPMELEVQIPGPVPSASVFGVSAESMQCSYDLKQNSVPTILLLMQDRLYSQGGLTAEGIFRINPENSEEEHVRNQLNRRIVPYDIDVHCLAGLIKAWFRELPSGVLDGLSPEQVLQCNTEEESVELVKQLKPTETALLNWAIDLMADVVEEEDSNKMNARNIAMVFAPNMTKMSDPLTALMHAVQVMNLLRTLIMRTLREREDTATFEYSPTSSHSSDPQTVDCLYSHHDMDTSCELKGPTANELYGQHDMDTSCEFKGSTAEDLYSQHDMDINYEMRGPTADHDDDTHYNSSGSEDDDEGKSLNEIESCFLRQLNEDINVKSNFGEQLHVELQKDHGSPNVESGISFTENKDENSVASRSNGECVKSESREQLHADLLKDYRSPNMVSYISFTESKNGNSVSSSQGQASFPEYKRLMEPISQ